MKEFIPIKPIKISLEDIEKYLNENFGKCSVQLGDYYWSEPEGQTIRIFCENKDIALRIGVGLTDLDSHHKECYEIGGNIITLYGEAVGFLAKHVAVKVLDDLDRRNTKKNEIPLVKSDLPLDPSHRDNELPREEEEEEEEDNESDFYKRMFKNKQICESLEKLFAPLPVKVAIDENSTVNIKIPKDDINHQNLHLVAFFLRENNIKHDVKIEDKNYIKSARIRLSAHVLTGLLQLSKTSQNIFEEFIKKNNKKNKENKKILEAITEKFISIAKEYLYEIKGINEKGALIIVFHTESCAGSVASRLKKQLAKAIDNTVLIPKEYIESLAKLLDIDIKKITEEINKEANKIEKTQNTTIGIKNFLEKEVKSHCGLKSYDFLNNGTLKLQFNNRNGADEFKKIVSSAGMGDVVFIPAKNFEALISNFEKKYPPKAKISEQHLLVSKKLRNKQQEPDEKEKSNYDGPK